MKIGIFLPNATFDLPGSPEVGGIETFAFTVGEAWQRLGHEVILFGGAPKLGRRHRATSLALELHPYWETKSIPDLGTRFQRLVQRLHFARSIDQAWTAHRCDAVLLSKPFDWPVAWRWKRTRPELQIVMGFHGTDFFAGDKLFYGGVDAAFAVSPNVADLAEQRVGRRPALIPNPVDVDFFSPAPVPSPPDDDWHLVSSGRLVGWKGFSNLLDAMAKLRGEIPIRLTLAGDGPERGPLQSKIGALGLNAKLCGLLDLEALRNLLRSGDLYVLPSIGLEAFSISALEAVCVGLPLALSDQVGLGAYLTPEDAATYPSQSVDNLAELLRALYAKRTAPDWIDRVARHARLREKFSPETVAREILALI